MPSLALWLIHRSFELCPMPTHIHNMGHSINRGHPFPQWCDLYPLVASERQSNRQFIFFLLSDQPLLVAVRSNLAIKLDLKRPLGSPKYTSNLGGAGDLLLLEEGLVLPGYLFFFLSCRLVLDRSLLSALPPFSPSSVLVPRMGSVNSITGDPIGYFF